MTLTEVRVACPAGLDPQAHGGLVPSRLGQGAEQLPESAGLVLGGQDQGGDHQVTGRVGHLVGEGPQRRGQALAFAGATAKVATSARIGRGARGAVATMACSRPAAPAMVSRSISAHPATASMRPTAACAPLAPPSSDGRAPAGQSSQHGADRPTGGRPDHDRRRRQPGRSAG